MIPFWHIWISPKRDPMLINSQTLLPSTTSLIHSLCLYICQFWIFHMNDIIPHVVFCDWLLPLSLYPCVMYEYFFLLPNNIPLYGFTHLISTLAFVFINLFFLFSCLCAPLTQSVWDKCLERVWLPFSAVFQRVIFLKSSFSRSNTITLK